MVWKIKYKKNKYRIMERISEEKNMSTNPYLDQYKNWKYTIIKISWELLEHEDFKETVEYIKYLKENNIPIILVYWWGNQISAKYLENTKKERPKGQDWNNITNDDVLTNWVIPAYKEISIKLSEIFWKENINSFSCSNMTSKKIELLWNVWKPIKFNKKLEKNKINLIGFVWIDEEGNKLNVNADDVAQKIAEECSQNDIEEEIETTSSKVNNIIYLTWTWWVEDKEWNIVPIITTEDLDKILELNYDKIKVDWWMLKKLKSINEQLKSWISRINVTGLQLLKKEIETKEWSGTMFTGKNYNNVV